MSPLPNIVVVGGSYVGGNVAKQLAAAFSGRFRVVMIEKNSHFQHLFAFPRFAVASGVETQKAFIPYVPGTFADAPPDSGVVVQARVTAIGSDAVQLDQQVSLDGATVDSIPYSFLVLATGTQLTPPSTMPGTEKLDGVNYLQKHAQKVVRSNKIAIIGGGAVGVQMATDIKELYPEKSVTLIHSRNHIMNRFHPQLHKIISDRFAELGIESKLGSRVKVPAGGDYPSDGSLFNVELEDGSSVASDFAIVCTGQTPQSDILKQLSPQSIKEDGFIRVLDTLQISDEKYGNIFAIGDVADTGAHKAAKPAGKQAEIVVQNIGHIVNKEPLDKYKFEGQPAIHLTLGIEKSVVFGNPPPGTEDWFTKNKTDGSFDMNIDGVWKRRGGGANPSL